MDPRNAGGTQHADALLRRILFLGGTPDIRPREFTRWPHRAEMLQKTWHWSTRCVPPCKGMALCGESVGDYVGRDLLLAQRCDTEEDHAYWLEKQLGRSEKIGLENYCRARPARAP